MNSRIKKIIKYEGKIDLSQTNSSHTQAFKSIQRIALGKYLKILEVGCSSGYFGNALKLVGHEVWGIEPDKIAANQAKKLLDFIFIGYVEDFFDIYKNEKFDVITFGDVLEHIADPEVILERAKKFLKKNGVIVVSIPNITHLSIRSMLLQGKWQYSPVGILDQTHLRFFCKESLIEMFTRCNYSILSFVSVRLSANEASTLTNTSNNHGFNLKALRESLDDNYLDFQYVATIKPTNNKAMLEKNKAFNSLFGIRVACVLNNINSSLFNIRLKAPLEAWAQNSGGHVVFLKFSDLPNLDLNWADVYLFQREATSQSLAVIKFLKEKGKKIIYEIDDLLTNLPTFLSHHISITHNKKNLEKSLELADVITTTTSRLAHELGSFNKTVVTIPNCNDPFQYQLIKHNRTSSKNVTLIVASSDKVRVDFLIPALKKVQKELGVKIFGIGPPGEFMKASGLNVQLIKLLSYDEFKAFIRSVDNAIGIIPLDDSLFSSCKSPIKFFDYSLAGIPTIASDVPPYRDHIQQNLNGLLVNNDTDSWVKSITLLTKDEFSRKKIALNAFDYTATHFNLDIAVKLWKETLENLVPNINLARAGSEKIEFNCLFSFVKKNLKKKINLFASLLHYYKCFRNKNIPFNFDPEFYLNMHEDVRDSGMDPYKHFLQYGIYEKRTFTYDRLY